MGAQGYVGGCGSGGLGLYLGLGAGACEDGGGSGGWTVGVVGDGVCGRSRRGTV